MLTNDKNENVFPRVVDYKKISVIGDGLESGERGKQYPDTYSHHHVCSMLVASADFSALKLKTAYLVGKQPKQAYWKRGDLLYW